MSRSMMGGMTGSGKMWLNRPGMAQCVRRIKRSRSHSGKAESK
jgi:hypothetical protein